MAYSTGHSSDDKRLLLDSLRKLSEIAGEEALAKITEVIEKISIAKENRGLFSKKSIKTSSELIDDFKKFLETANETIDTTFVKLRVDTESSSIEDIIYKLEANYEEKGVSYQGNRSKALDALTNIIESKSVIDASKGKERRNALDQFKLACLEALTVEQAENKENIYEEPVPLIDQKSKSKPETPVIDSEDDLYEEVIPKETKEKDIYEDAFQEAKDQEEVYVDAIQKPEDDEIYETYDEGIYENVASELRDKQDQSWTKKEEERQIDKENGQSR